MKRTHTLLAMVISISSCDDDPPSIHDGRCAELADFALCYRPGHPGEGQQCAEKYNVNAEPFVRIENGTHTDYDLAEVVGMFRYCDRSSY